MDYISNPIQLFQQKTFFYNPCPCVFKVKNTQLNSLTQAFGKLITSIKFDGFVGMG